MMLPMQSAYRRFHSTETAVTTVYSDLLLAADVGQVSALCLLDLTAAFDTVDHQLLLHRLERQFGLRGVVLAWFASYLTDRSFRVLLDGGDMSAEVSVRSHKVQFSDRDFSSSIWRTLLMWLLDTM